MKAESHENLLGLVLGPNNMSTLGPKHKHREQETAQEEGERPPQVFRPLLPPAPRLPLCLEPRPQPCN